MPDKRAKVNWLAIRTAYVVKRWTPAKISAEFGIHPTTVKTRAAKEGWTAERDRNATAGDLVATDESRKVVDAAAAERAQSDRAFTDSLQALVEAGKAKLAEIKDPAEYIMAASRLVASGQRVVLTRRIVTGTVPGQPSDFVAADDSDDDEIDNTITIVKRRLEPTRILTDANGRALVNE
jgi:hypothetical protein